jgi:hypothetical protein
MNVEVTVVHVDVPAEQVEDERKDCRMIDQLEEAAIEAEKRELVQDGTVLRAVCVPDTTDGIAQAPQLDAAEHIRQHDIAVALERRAPIGHDC